jgi:hypothetical protein
MLNCFSQLGEFFEDKLERSVIRVQFNQTECLPSCQSDCPLFSTVSLVAVTETDGSITVHAPSATPSTCAISSGAPASLLFDSNACSDGSRLVTPSAFAANIRFIARNFTNLTWDQPYPLASSMLSGEYCYLN